MAAIGDKNVGGLDIAVNNSLGVCCIQRLRDFDCEVQEFVKRQRPAGDAMFQRGSFQEFHGDEPAPAVFGNFVDGADVRMV